MNFNEIKVSICTCFGAAGAVITRALGGWSEDIVTLLIFMAIDYITGIIVAGVFKSSGKTETGAISSKASFKGLCKKCVMLMFVLLAHRLDMAVGANYIRSATVIGFMLNELISIVENAGLMGLPLPEIITKAIEILKNKKE